MKNRILIVDDAYINRELLKEMLSENYEILEAENGKEALDIVENEKHTLDGTVDRIIEYMADSCQMKEEYRKRMDETFAFNDRNCSKRVYERIIENR